MDTHTDVQQEGQKDAQHHSSLSPSETGPEPISFASAVLDHPATFAFSVAGIVVAGGLAILVLGVFYEVVTGNAL